MSDLLNSASLVMIPSGYKEDVVYSQIPTDGSGDLSFTRASNGTRVNSAGLVEVCPWNLATNSENYTLWNLANVTVTANDITAPNGTLTADKLTISSNGNDVKQTISVMPNSVYTWTFYVYGGTALGQQGRFYDNTNGANIEYYNYSSSVVLGAWVKIERTFTTPSGCFEIQAWVLAATSTIGTMWAWGAQLNIGSTAKPYFPTTDRLNVPRLTYQNGGGGCPSLLLEKQSTNLVTYSNDATQQGFNNMSATANTATSPDGTQNADTITPSAGTSDHYLITGGASVSSGVIFTASVFVKKKDSDYLYFGTGGAAAWGSVAYRFSTNTFFNVGGGVTSYNATDMGNGWIRLTNTGTTGGTDLRILLTPSDSSGARTFNANGTDGLYIWGLQIEQSSYVTSAIETTSSSATRVADACFKTGISSLIGQTEGTLFAEVNLTTLQGAVARTFIDIGSSSNRVFLGFTSLASNTIRLQIDTASGTGVVDFRAVVSSAGTIKVAGAYKNGDCALYVNGVAGTMVANGSISFTTISNLFLGQTLSSTAILNDGISQAIVFPTRLTNSECIALTTI